MTYFVVHDSLYGNDLHVYVGCSGPAIAKHLGKKLMIPHVDMPPQGAAHARFCTITINDKPHYVLWLMHNKGKLRIHHYPLLAHEVLHFVFASLKDVGIEYSSASEEAFTYYLQATLTAVLHEIVRKGLT